MSFLYSAVLSQDFKQGRNKKSFLKASISAGKMNGEQALKNLLCIQCLKLFLWKGIW
jgi:hypothetical protein